MRVLFGLLALSLCSCGLSDAPGGASDASLDTSDAGSTGGSGGSTDAGSAAAGGEAGAGRPERLRAEGVAAGVAEAGTDRVDCHFYATLEPLVLADDGGISGMVVGEVFRTITINDQVSEFSALIGGDGSLMRVGDGVEVRIVGDQPPNAKPFWLELEVLSGTESNPFYYDGAWNCAPLDAEGFSDLDLTVTGTWQIRPEP
jgi:hypothetical protein